MHQQGVYDQHGRQQQPVGSQLGYGGQPDAAALAAALSTQLQVDSSNQRGEGYASAHTLLPASPPLSFCIHAHAGATHINFLPALDLLLCFAADSQAYLPQQPHSQARYAQHQQQASQQPLHDQGLPDLVGPHPLEAARRHSSGNLRGSAPDLQGLTGRLTARWACRLVVGLELTTVPWSWLCHYLILHAG